MYNFKLTPVVTVQFAGHSELLAESREFLDALLKFGRECL